MPPREGLAWLSSIGIRATAFSATDPLTRPRDLDRSARRDLVAIMSRLELRCACVDCFLPTAHFLDAAQVDRATAAAIDAIEFAAEIATLEGRIGGGTVVLSVPTTKDKLAQDALDAISATAQHQGVHVAVPTCDASLVFQPFLVALDPAQILANNQDPLTIALASSRRIGAVRIVDLLRSGSRGPIGEPQEAQLDCRGFASGCRAAGFEGEFVVDLRQWHDPRGGLLATLSRWQSEVEV